MLIIIAAFAVTVIMVYLIREAFRGLCMDNCHCCRGLYWIS